MKSHRAFTLIELLVVISIIGILAAMLAPALHHAKSRTRQGICLNNLRQVNLAIRFYAEDSQDALPVVPDPNPFPNGIGAYYKQLVKGYLGLIGEASSEEKVFNCPNDRKIRMQRDHAFTSYTFNGYEVGPGSIPRITGKPMSAIPNPGKAVLVAEWPGFFGGSWHPLKEEAYQDAPVMVSFVDGHAATTKIYWNGIPGTSPRNYEPPAGYAYSWSGE